MLRTLSILVISDALMQDRIFDQNHPKYWNFATFGSIVSHEIMHGFDSNVRICSCFIFFITHTNI